MPSKESKVSIVLIHRGDSSYLHVTLLQLRQTNPDATIYLIGEIDSAYYKSLVKHVLIENYFSRADQFKKIYKHYSTNGYDFELICLQRWFVLLEFMEAYSLEKCIYLDSDVLVYSDLNDVQPDLDKYGMTYSGISAHTNFVNRRDALGDFCNLIWNAYADEGVEAELSVRFKKFKEEFSFGGISDMSFLMDFAKANPEAMCDLSQVREETVFDITLDNVRDFVKDDRSGLKKIIWKDKIPFAIQSSNERHIRFHTLHFQGKCKTKIGSYATFTFMQRLVSYSWLLRFYFRRILRKVAG